MTQVREELISLRKALGMTQQELSNHLKVALTTVARWETVRTPARKELLKLELLAVDSGLPVVAENFRKARMSALQWSRHYGQD